MKSASILPGAPGRILILLCLLMFAVVRSYGQGVCDDCPTLAECEPCSGGLTNLVVNYDGIVITASATDLGDGSALAVSLLSSELTITKPGGGPFVGNVSVSVIYLSLPLNLTDTEVINTSCSPPVYEGEEFGNFTIVSGASVAGPLCCSPGETQTIPDPVFTDCPSGQTLSLISGCTRMAFWTEPTAIDGCGEAVTLTRSHAPGHSFGVGPTTVVYTATDPYGNTSTCEFDITITDGIVPQFTACPNDRSETVDANCQLTLPNYVGLAAASDNCDANVTITQLPLPGTVITTSQTVTLTAEDDYGNKRTCDFFVTLIDDTPPQITCPGNMNVAANHPSNCSYTIGDFTDDAIVDDNCDNNITIIQSPPPGTLLSGEGNTQDITLTATDDFGNSDQCVFTITLIDTTDPQITCPADRNEEVDANCEFEIPDYRSLATTFDKCDGNVEITQSPAVGTKISGVGFMQAITLTARDNANNEDQCSFNVTLVDAIKPSISCPADFDVFTTNCSFTIPSYMHLAIKGDNCDNAVNVIQSPPPGTKLTGHGNTLQITLTAFDDTGNSNSCNFTITLKDNVPPQFTLSPVSQDVAVDGNCQFSMPDYTDAAAASDNCDADVEITQSPAVGSVINGQGTTQVVTLTAKDDAGNTSTSNFTLTLIDTTPPQFTCESDQDVDVNANCSFVIPDYGTLIPTTDNCDTNVIVQQSIAAGTIITGVGETRTITLTATDDSNNTTQCSFTITLTDGIAPTITSCQGDISKSLDAGCDYLLEDFTDEIEATDNCTDGTNITYTQSPAPGTPLSGDGTIHTITLTATDEYNNSATCTFDITIEDTTAPTITLCQSDLSKDLDAGCDYVLEDFTDQIEATDNCTISTNITYTQSPVPGTLFSGDGTTHTITLTATDEYNNSASCTFDITIEDTTSPTISALPPNVTLTAGDNGKATHTWTNPSISDNCDQTLNITSTHTSGYEFPFGDHTVTFTATDDALNQSTASFTVKVEDHTPPVIADLPEDVTLTAAENGKAVYAWTDPNVEDNCDATPEIVSDYPSGYPFTIGRTQVTFTATDDSGNKSQEDFLVVVEDKTAPVISNMPGDITLSANASCVAAHSWNLPSVTDNNGDADPDLRSNFSPGHEFPLGETIVTYTATDNAGNAISESFTVTVTDDTDPIITEYPATVKAFAIESCTAIATWSEPKIEDCSSVVVDRSHSSGDTFPIGTTEVTYTVTDQDENVSTCTFNVIVEDKTPPVFTGCPGELIVKADASCNASVSWNEPSASDNCDIATVTSSHHPGDIFPKGVTEVVYTATDIYGNVSYCKFNVSVQNEHPPVIAGCVEDIEMKAGESGEVQVQWVPPTTTVQCGEVTLTSTHSPGDLFPLGTTAVEYKATDSDGNFSVCIFNIHVTYEDVQFNVVPVITPDGDGINDQWTLGNIEKFSDNKVVIVDRWGSVIFSATGYNNETIVWKGTNSSGGVVPTGTYFYTITVRIGPALHEKKGFIELLK